MGTEDEKKTVEETSKEGLQWLEGNPDADADAIQGKQKELEAKFNPIMMRVYQATGAGGAPGGMPGGGMPGGGMPGGAPEVVPLDQLKVLMTLTDPASKDNRYK